MTPPFVPSDRRRRQSGQSLIEFALSAMVFLMLLLGIMNIAYGVFCYHMISSAAREAVRYAVVRGPNSSTPATTSEIQQAGAKAAVGVYLPLNNVTVSWPVDANLPTMNDAKVTISLDYNLFMTPIALTLTSTSQMLASQ